MSIFSFRKEEIRVCIDVGSSTIKTVIFSLPHHKRQEIQGIRKTVTQLKPSYDAKRTISLLHEILFSVIKDIGRAPTHILIGLGASLMESSLQRWSLDIQGMHRPLSREQVRSYFRSLFDSHRDHERACLAHPLDVLINGYPIDTNILDRKYRGTVKEIAFTTILAYFSPKIGSAIADLRTMFGGISIEFVPLAVCIKEGVVRALKLRDVFIIDAGGKETQLMLIKEGRLIHAASFPLGADALAEEGSSPMREQASATVRQNPERSENTNETDEIDHLLAQRSNAWRERLQTELDSFYFAGALPADILLLGGGAAKPQIQSTLWAEDIVKNFIYKDSPRIQIITGALFMGSSALDGLLRATQDAGTAALIYYSLNHKPLF